MRHGLRLIQIILSGDHMVLRKSFSIFEDINICNKFTVVTNHVCWFHLGPRS